MTDAVDCGHLIEIYDFPPELKTCDLLAAFIEFKYVNLYSFRWKTVGRFQLAAVL